MNDDARQKLAWGWLRLLLGFLQMGFSAAALGAFLAVGLRPITFAFVIAATLTTIASRLLYHWRRKPTHPT